jgi:LysR family transcriptional regulator (chromosome initiation inhibitor)
MANLDYRGLAVLDAVASSGSFEKAALALGISQSAVSQRIKALEDTAGRLLVVRGVPSVPTGLGQRLVAHYRNVKLMEAALDIDLGHSPSMPDVTLAVDTDSLSTWFGRALPALMMPPRCQMEVRTAEAEEALALVREGAVYGCVAAVAPGQDNASGTSMTVLGTMRYQCVATPAFAAHWFGDSFQVDAVKLAPAVVSERKLLGRFLQQQLGFTGAHPRHMLPVPDACIADGVAYGLMPELLAVAPVAAGSLVDLLPGRTLDVELAWHAWNIDTPFTRTLSEHVIATAKKYLLQP